MKNILVLAIVGAIVLFSGCSDQGPVVATQDTNYEQTVATVDNNTRALAKPDAALLSWSAPMFDYTYYKHGATWESLENGAVLVHERYKTFENVPINGGLVGQFVMIEHNSDINKATGNGRAWGTYVMEANLAGTPATGVFKGHYYGLVQNWKFVQVGPPGVSSSGIFGAGERYIRGLNWYGFLATDGPVSNMKFLGLVNTPKGM